MVGDEDENTSRIRAAEAVIETPRHSHVVVERRSEDERQGRDDYANFGEAHGVDSTLALSRTAIRERGGL